jgi:site-specific recombinase XerD
VSTPKTEKGKRKIPINNATEKVLFAQKSNNHIFVFASQNGTALNRRNILRAFSSILTNANLPKHFTTHSQHV